MHPYLIGELARLREQEIERAALPAFEARNLGGDRHRRGVPAWLARRVRWWFAPGGACLGSGSGLPPTLQPGIRREAR
ncbi:MAG: hypothetical protein ABSA40_08465 [Candidatus Dormibacteria bacterium]|jgi:hypothetical protein